jgi:hypothetical protein
MSSEQKPTLNLYGILDNEMTRMHQLLQTYMTLPQEQTYSRGGGLSSFGQTSPGTQIPMLYKRIIDMQDLLLKAVVAHDAVIQDKIAELALTGAKDETIPSR